MLVGAVRIIIFVLLCLVASACTKANSGIFAGPVTGVVIAGDCIASGPTFFNDQGRSSEKTCFVYAVGKLGECVKVETHTPAVNGRPPYRFPVDSSNPIDSKAFELSLASSGGGQSTALAAAEHLRVPGVSLPPSGWLLASTASDGAWILSGKTYVHAVQGPDDTWQIDRGMDCG